jgi:hypothetical protein
MGHIIPAGTGFHNHRSVKVKPLVEIEEEEPMPSEAAQVLLEEPLAS